MTDTVVLIHGFLIDGNGEDPLADTTVVVENGVIREVGTKTVSLKNATTIDLNGKTLMPGLTDAHVHVGNIELDMAKTVALPPAVYVHRATQNLETDLQLGFTTLRDAGGLDWGFREAVDLGLIRGPRLLLSVNMLSQTGGHGDKRGPGNEQNTPRNSIGMYPEICDGPDEVRRAARQALRRGADQIKVMADGGVASPSDRPGQWQFEVDELRAAVQVAKAAGTYVMAHCYTDRAVRNCLEAGVRSIEHGNLITPETVDAMVRQNAYLVPTCTTYQVLKQFGETHGLSSFVLQKLDSVVDAGMRSLELAYREGVRIGSGTDIIGPFQHMKIREFAIKAEIMSPMDILVSATRTNAELFGLSDQIGTIEPGKQADIIVVDGNPLEDISIFEQAAQRVALVMKGGKIFKNIL
jgi:imidazolonepropionase-like amidohydrolase